jgi:hypothetical protein
MQQTADAYRGVAGIRLENGRVVLQ